jgi:type III restriction enzyme
MKLQFKEDLDYQLEGMSSIVNIFKGQTPAQANFTVSALMDKAGTEGKLITDLGIGNKLELDEEDILKNVREIQLKNGLKPSTLKDLGKNNFKFTVEMETGERVIIVMGAVCVIKSRVSGTLDKYISCIA